ncbi:hypothetical protein [Azohydromonas australica]|uniref:hypothetical protein n=1 Tax=Azohydromonas australica TaxID=364039 RepID=UPI0012EC41F5|nr:hypothetical protein [Azohydromonas australica]
MQLNAGDAGRRRQRKTSKRKSNRKPEDVRRQSLHAEGAAASTPTRSGHSTQAKSSKAELPGETFQIEIELQGLKNTAQVHRRPHHREAAMLVLAAAGCFLIPASAAHLLLNLQDWAFLTTIALLAVWLLVRMRRYQAALNKHFDKRLARINQVVADPSRRLVFRSSLAKLRAEWLAPRKFFEADSSLFAALVLYVIALLAAHAFGSVR